MSSSVLEEFSDVKIDAIGEIQNITMGSAATAVSNLLSAKVWITTPRVSVIKSSDLSYPELEPSVHVKIQYTKGVSGSSVLVLKQSDVQLILNQLMGLPLVVSDDFEFDEMNISAVCEVMNQMMGASATALSELIDTPIDISTPEAFVDAKDGVLELQGINVDDYICTVAFDLTIDGIIKSEFITVISLDLAREMADKMLQGYNTALEEVAPAPVPETPVPPAPSGGMLSQEEIERLLSGASAPQAKSEPTPPPVQTPVFPQATAPQPAPVPVIPQTPASQPAPAPQPFFDPYAQQPQQQGYYSQPQQPQYGAGMPMQTGTAAQYQQPQHNYAFAPQNQVQKAGSVNVQNIQLQSFESYDTPQLAAEQSDNLQLLMNVPLNVTVEIGSSKRKVKEILDFTQGTIIELERQAGAPVDVIVNGNLIARGDVVVIDDNFAVRITEIIKSKLLDSLGNKE